MLYLPYVSPISPLYLAFIVATMREAHVHVVPRVEAGRMARQRHPSRLLAFGICFAVTLTLRRNPNPRESLAVTLTQP